MKKHLPLIVSLLTLGGLLTACDSNQANLIPDGPTSYYSQEECENETGKTCVLVTCEIAEGESFEEVCGLNFKEGWQAK